MENYKIYNIKLKDNTDYSIGFMDNKNKDFEKMLNQYEIPYSIETRNRCDDCGKFDDTVSYREDPYIKELYGQSQFEYLCDDCYNKSLEDI